ncbi:hypothetical protein [Clostridium felsineum]|uniref:Uncharacterized protein n=1 Tax=Clostridium felsineum TaxID=36839 RepID=A0A1S8LQS1_9CLOT|nr:hypothetical protein [Clostridium felsineum]MCR3759526.1 hypothetical protein [Clostridium felsineum]URZ04210.1 hypothetical protein CLAUR_042980 [Clostridium felsineum]URZ07601.1 hypothetical protein CLROS_029400 [Clostridium felsineum]URZ12632.1 hypothetical protein CROST_033550 [Clostridium felsineum]URZ17275.1 hypothetical protein CLFE_033280 [Clostridium felsineum DSM 794]
MKETIKKIFNSEYFKKMMIYSIFSSPNLSKNDYMYFNNMLREMDSDKVELKKAS